MTEEVLAQSHALVDALAVEAGSVALSALQTIGDHTQGYGGPFARVLGVVFSEYGGGRCSAALDVKEHLLNPHGIAHGGVTYSLADYACGGAALSVLGEARLVTQDMHLRYHGPARPGRLVAQAEVVHHGRRTITTHCRVTQHDVLVATVTATFAILSDAELDNLKK